MTERHERYVEAIDLATDGGLDPAGRRELDEHLAGCADCRAELSRAEAVAVRLGEAKLAVRAGFAREVSEAIAALEPAPWEARSPRAWRLPVALVLVVGGLAAALLGSGAAAFSGQSTGGAGGAMFALADLFRASLVAGAGLAAASWRAVGDAAASWLGSSRANWIAAIVLVGGVNYLLFRLLRVRRPPAESAAALAVPARRR